MLLKIPLFRRLFYLFGDLSPCCFIPIFIAEIDPLKLQVIRATEREAIPENNAAMGNFGICQISDSECWVTCGDGAQTGPRKGKVNKIMFARIVAP